MATQPDLAAYIASVRHRYIDVDGVFGAQCWDQWSHYAQWLGVPAIRTYTWYGGSLPHSGYACNVYHHAKAAGLDQWFEILPTTATPRAGDVAFWEYGSAWYPWSHVATVLEVTHGGRMLRCLTQNPGYVQVADLITNGIIGYLRPKALTTTAVDTTRTPTITYREKQTRRKKKIMAMYYYEHARGRGKEGWLVLGVTPRPLILATQASANEWSQRIGEKAKKTTAGGFKTYLAAAGGTPEQLAAVWEA